MTEELPPGYEGFEPSDLDRQAWFQQADRWTWDLVDLETKGANASAVAIALDDYRFLATAAHVLRDRHRIQVSTRMGRSDVPLDFADRFWDDPSDIGLLQLSSTQADIIADFGDRSRLLTGLDVSFGWPVLVAGYLSCQKLRPDDRTLVAIGSNCVTEALPESQWPKEFLAADTCDLVCPQVGRDLFIGYSEESEAQYNSRTIPFSKARGNLVRTPHPGGFSGGGIWMTHLSRRPGGVIYHDLKLIGLQRGRLEQHRMLRGTVIDQWLDLVARHYPDLRETISEVKEKSKMKKASGS